MVTQHEDIIDLIHALAEQGKVEASVLYAEWIAHDDATPVSVGSYWIEQLPSKQSVVGSNPT